MAGPLAAAAQQPASADRLIAEAVQIRVHDSTADMRYLVLPMRPKGTEGWDEARLAGIVTRDSMIGVAVPAVG